MKRNRLISPFWYLMIPFVFIGYIIYMCIGLPLAGLISGWIIARDEIMSSRTKIVEVKNEKTTIKKEEPKPTTYRYTQI